MSEVAPKLAYAKGLASRADNAIGWRVIIGSVFAVASVGFLYTDPTQFALLAALLGAVGGYVLLVAAIATGVRLGREASPSVADLAQLDTGPTSAAEQ